jgi:ferric-dicitrate binding protein FerR (iron transport regulator)
MNISKDDRLEQAARWLARSRDRDFTPEDKKLMVAWLEESLHLRKNISTRKFSSVTAKLKDSHV